MILLQRRAGAAKTAAELRLLLVNDTALLVPYLTAVLVDGRGKVQAVSGLPTPNRDAPFTRLAQRLARKHLRGKPAAADPDDELLAPERAWLPLGAQGHLLLARREPWQDGERQLLQPWLDHAGMALGSKGTPSVGARGWLGRLGWTVVLAGLAAAMAIPVPLTVLAPAEVVPRDPDVVRATLNGVVEDILVEPNQTVRAGDVVVRLDPRELQTRLDVVRQALEIAQAELRQAQASALQSREAQSALPILRSRIDQRRAEVTLVESQLARIAIPAGRDGIVLLPDPASLRGRPVRQGERLFTIADPAAGELELWIAAADMIDFGADAAVTLFLTVDPDRSIPARVRQLSHQAQPSPDGPIGFRALARFEGEPPRLGLRGIARIAGPDVPLGFYLFRRPIAAVRQQVGL